MISLQGDQNTVLSSPRLGESSCNSCHWTWNILQLKLVFQWNLVKHARNIYQSRFVVNSTQFCEYENDDSVNTARCPRNLFFPIKSRVLWIFSNVTRVFCTLTLFRFAKEDQLLSTNLWTASFAFVSLLRAKSVADLFRSCSRRDWLASLFMRAGSKWTPGES